MADFNWVEGSTPVQQIVKSLATALTTTVEHKWTLEYPADVNTITTVAILSTTTTFSRKFYIKFEKPADSLTYMFVTIGTELITDKSDFEASKHDEPSRWAWYRENPNLYLGDFLRVSYWISFNDDYANIIIQGDSSADVAPYNNALISPCFIGACASYTNAAPDEDYNWFKTVGSDIEPTQVFTFGQNTATGVLDASFVGTKSGMPYQRHGCKYFADNPYADTNFIQSSAWTKSEHTSEIVWRHAVDRERGKVQNAFILDQQSIFHLTELTLDKGQPTEKIYIMFKPNVPFSFINGGPNPTYGVALRKS